MSDHAPHAYCENCGTALQGGYCHLCGQSVHNPIRHAGHALEEVFESFWHLDGRVFRTLRDLLVPGRVARDYIAGHRARYIAPLRLFVILSLLTFFVGQFAVRFEGNAITTGDGPAALGIGGELAGQIDRATTRVEVERLRDEALAELEQARKEVDGVPVRGVQGGLIAASVVINGIANDRITQLQRDDAGPPAAAPDAAATPPTNAADAADGDADAAQAQTPFNVQFNDRPWHPVDNPVRVSWWPKLADTWLNRQIGRAQDNIPRLQRDPALFVQSVLRAVPTALFVLVPVFALLLKLGYIGRRRLYLEHLVVALYSHGFLLLCLLVMFVLAGMDNWLTPPGSRVDVLIGAAMFGLWCWIPIYLLLMQKRVYGQGWPLTLVKYLVLGNLYFVLVSLATAAVLVAGVVGA